MGIIKSIKEVGKKTMFYPIYLAVYFKIINRNSSPLKEINKRIRNNDLLKDLAGEQLASWNARIEDVIASEDNKKIDCVKNAGKLKKGLLVMHNGLLIEPLSYYGYPVLKMLMKNKGIHEPQEEFVFQEVLKEMPKGATMIELGAYWSFYSMWFKKIVPDSRTYMIEPGQIGSGVNNFKINKLEGHFFKYSVADKTSSNPDGSKTVAVDDFVKENNIDFVDILHSDIQGNELLMLYGAHRTLAEKKVGYVFISTHSEKLHIDCGNFLNNLGFIQVCSADMQETYSVDGLLVYKNPDYKGIDRIGISRRIVTSKAYNE